MIRYTLSCGKEHEFESWFQSAAAFDSLCTSGQVTCPVCGDAQVEKSLMSPALRPSHNAAPEPARPDLSVPASRLEEAMAEMRRQIEANSDYVGVNFVAEARAMQDGSAPERSIYGEARLEDARKLLEDGIPVSPLPFLPARKTN